MQTLFLHGCESHNTAAEKTPGAGQKGSTSDISLVVGLYIVGEIEKSEVPVYNKDWPRVTPREWELC